MSTDKLDNVDVDKSESAASKLASLKQQRTSMKRNITQMKTKIEKDGSAADFTILDCRLQILESYFKQISHIQSQIEKLDETDTNRSDIEELFISAKAPLVSFMNMKRSSCDGDQSFLNTSQPVIAHHHRLPQMKLPKFDGKYSEFSRFLSTFKTLVHNETGISTIDKFNYLLNCLSGQALAVIEPFQVIESNYQKAVDALIERYDNKSLIFIDHINSLFSIPQLNKPNAVSLRSILDTVSALRNSVLSLGSELDVMNAIIIHIVLSKIDEESKRVYDEQQDFKSLPSWDKCHSILSRRCQYLESRTAEAGSVHSRNNKPTPNTKRPGSSLLVSQTLCEHCKSQDHLTGSCPSYLSLPIPRRFDFVKSSKLCLNCLRKGHTVSTCMSKSRCRICRISHHTSLHNPKQNTNTSSSDSSLAPNASSNLSLQQPHSSSFQPSSFSRQSVPTLGNSGSTYLSTLSSYITFHHRINLLPTAIIFVENSFGTLQPLRALLDSCSEVNLITQEAVKLLRLKQFKSTQEISGVSEIRTQLQYMVTTTIKSRISEFKWTADFLVTKSISSKHPAEQINTTTWKIPSDLQLADPLFYKPQRIDILLNSEVFFQLLLEGKISLGNGLPCLINTSLGWIVGGGVNHQVPYRTLSCNVITKENDLDTLLKAFWEIEEFNQSSPVLTEEEQQCEEHFSQNTSLDSTGRVKVRLPFKSITQLGNSVEVARRRLLYLEKRFSKDENLRQMYCDFMDEYIRLGHMSPVTFDRLDFLHYVIPHHPVLRPQSTTTKLRVVFDASCRTSNNLSLNETLMVGPTIQQDLIITMLAFRLNRLALSADICKMYRQFLVDERDRNFQLILWRNTVTDPITLYQLNTVTYGTSAAPFLAVRSLFFIADFYKDEFPVGSATLKQDLYVDDLLTGADNIFDLSRKKFELIEILQKAKLQLSKWNSNCPTIAPSSGEMPLKTNEEYITKALGMSWKPKKDVFCFRFELPAIEVVTKRSVLSVVAKIFDVLGILSPIVISCKIFIQELWKQKLDWDTPLNERLSNRWHQIENSFPDINSLEIPRFVGTSPQSPFDIHGFADASQLAYGCCFYIRAASKNEIKTNLLIAKSKVAPLAHQSLPRLELCAALLLSRTWNKIKSKFDRFTYRIFFWSDSKIVLNWLTNHSSSFVCFVANRVSEIQNMTHNIPWRYVPSKQNPADIVSRGCLVKDLKPTIWLTGPKFLSEAETNWPTSNIENVELPIQETRKTLLKAAVVIDSIISNLVSRHSSYLRILRIIAFVHRVFNKHQHDKFITAEEIKFALYRVIHDIQQSIFKEEIDLLDKGETLNPSLQRLAPFLDKVQYGSLTLIILRVGGRLANAPFSYETRFPVLLPKDHRFTKLLIEYLHRKHLHAGSKALLGILRQQVWIINGREAVRKVIRNCVHCFKYKPRLLQQIMGNLPADRFKAQRPFLVSGVDFCGPFYTSYRIRGKAPYKTYVAIFVCFSSKAVHIELVSDLSTNTFLLCLKRFIGRRGIPMRLYCDNATNFVGASSKLQEFKQRFFDDANINQLLQYSTTTGFNFSFIPPRSPHFGGLWESAVKSMKTILVKNMSQANLTYEEFQTVLIEVEAILNSRPLAPRSDDPNDGEALTPAHMLIGTSLMALPDENLKECQNINYLKHWQRVTYLKQQFWVQWVRDYVLNLQPRCKWLKESKNVQEGQLVIVHEDNMPPQHWLLARIVKTIPGQDGRVRVVHLKTPKGFLKRSIHKIAPLPTEDN